MTLPAPLPPAQTHVEPSPVRLLDRMPRRTRVRALPAGTAPACDSALSSLLRRVGQNPEDAQTQAQTDEVTR